MYRFYPTDSGDSVNLQWNLNVFVSVLSVFPNIRNENCRNNWFFLLYTSWPCNSYKVCKPCDEVSEAIVGLLLLLYDAWGEKESFQIVMLYVLLSQNQPCNLLQHHVSLMKALWRHRHKDSSKTAGTYVVFFLWLEKMAVCLSSFVRGVKTLPMLIFL